MRLIDADALITFWTECLTQEEIDTWDMRIATVIENVKDQPTVDAVPVVRCEDCKWGKEACGNIECFVDLNAPSEYHGYKWFCPYGEKR